MPGICQAALNMALSPPSATGAHLHDIHLPPRAAQVFEQQPRCSHVLRVCQVLGVPTGGPLQGLRYKQAGECIKVSATLGRCNTEMSQWMLASACKRSLIYYNRTCTSARLV